MSISPVVRRARSFQDLLAIPGGDGPYVFTRMFREGGGVERRRARRHFKLLKRLDGAIREVLDPGEKVVFLTAGRGLSFWERWVLGWRRAVVLTDRRTLLLQLDASARPRLAHQQVTRDAIAEVKEGSWGRVELRTRAGETVELRGLHPSDAARVAEALRAGTQRKGLTPTSVGVQRLCPRCHEPLRGRPKACPRCLRSFHRGWLTALSSLAVPGLGNFLIGYRGFATLELLAAASIWVAYLLGPWAWGGTLGTSLLAPGWVFAIVHGTDAVLAWHVSRSGVFVAERK